jgi:hypothetical protein
VSPGLISYSALLSQLNTTDDPLTAADVAKLSTVPAQPFTFTIPNGNKVSGVKATDFVQINEPPTLYAAGAPGDPGAPNSADYRAAFSCDNEANPAVGVGDWVQPLDGQKAAQTRLGMANVAGQTIEVLLADTFGTPAGCPNGQGSGPLNGCFQVKYIAAFHVTAVGNMSISGYFTSISVPGGGIVTSSTSPGPVEQVTKIRLVY